MVHGQYAGKKKKCSGGYICLMITVLIGIVRHIVAVAIVFVAVAVAVAVVVVVVVVVVKIDMSWSPLYHASRERVSEC